MGFLSMLSIVTLFERLVQNTSISKVLPHIFSWSTNLFTGSASVYTTTGILLQVQKEAFLLVDISVGGTV